VKLEEMFRDYHGLVFRTAYRITGNAADAEDVLQTVFLRLANGTTATPERPESYLRRAAVNAALDVLRARRQSRNVPLDGLEHSPSLARKADDGVLRDGLRRALAALDARAAEIFALRFLEGLTNAEIAHELGLNTVLVAVAVHRARKQLQHSLQRYLVRDKEDSPHVRA
jgi:RNA polymerase sigma-70 factor (ECF subfamily)